MASHQEEKKPIYQKWWFWVIIVIVVIVVIGGTQGETTNTSTESVANTQTEAENNTQTTSNINKDIRATLEQYNQVQDGMTYDEVVAIFGGKETSSSESEIAGIKSEVKTWNGNGTFSVATIGFTNGKVSSKSQTGLE